MKIDDMQALANKLLAQDGTSVFGSLSWWRANAIDLARAVADLLAASASCGYTITPDVDEHGPHVKFVDDRMSLDDAQSVAVTLLRARDEAEAKSGG